MSPAGSRLRQFLEYKHSSLSEFERRCGFSHGYVSNIRRAPSASACSRIARHYPELNTEWLVSGKGEMLTAEASILPVPDNERSRYQDMITARNVRIMELEELIIELQRKLDETKFIV